MSLKTRATGYMKQAGVAKETALLLLQRAMVEGGLEAIARKGYPDAVVNVLKIYRDQKLKDASGDAATPKLAALRGLKMAGLANDEREMLLDLVEQPCGMARVKALAYSRPIQQILYRYKSAILPKQTATVTYRKSLRSGSSDISEPVS